MRRGFAVSVVGLATIASSGCSDASVAECGEGAPVDAAGVSYCVFTAEEAGGFLAVPDCPAAVPNAVWLAGALVCAGEATTVAALPEAVFDVLGFATCTGGISVEVQQANECLIATHLDDDPVTRDNEAERNLCVMNASRIPLRIDENRAISDPIGDCGGSLRVLSTSMDFGAVTANGDVGLDAYPQITIDARIFLAPVPSDRVSSMTGTIALQADGQYTLVVGTGHLAATLGLPCSFDPMATGRPSFWRLAGDPATFPQDARWHRVTGVYDIEAELVELYVDGALVASSDNTPASDVPCENRPGASTSGVEIGFSDFAGAFPGWIDELTIRAGLYPPTGP